MKTLLFVVLALLGVVLGLALLVDKMIHGNTERVKTRLRCFLSKRGKAAGLLGFVVLWFLFPDLAELTTEDGQKPVMMDVGVFQTLPLALIRGLVLYSFTKLFLKMEVTTIHRYFTRGRVWVRDFVSLTPWEKQLLTAIYLLGFLALFIQLTR